MEPPYPGGRGVLDVIPGGPHELTDAEARGVFTRIWLAWGRAKICHAFYERQRFHSAAVWTRAVQELVKQGTHVWSLSLVEAVAGEIETGKGKPSPRLEPAAPALPVHVAPPDSPWRGPPKAPYAVRKELAERERRKAEAARRNGQDPTP